MLLTKVVDLFLIKLRRAVPKEVRQKTDKHVISNKIDVFPIHFHINYLSCNSSDYVLAFLLFLY